MLWRFWNTGSSPNLLVVAMGLLACALPAQAQSSTGTSSSESDNGPIVVDSKVGYIDSAIPESQFRLRFDAAYKDRRPSRAEFFYAKGSVGAPGLPLPETNVDFQELTSYFEWAFSPQFSAFLESPVRFLNPEINANHTGVGDINTGFKYAFWQTNDTTASFQFRTDLPTGDARRGLGTDHVSLEPALLINQRLGNRLMLEEEFRTWVPVGGTDFAGDILRYGIGLSYGERRQEGWWMAPVFEVVGWTVLDGKKQVVQSPAFPIVPSASGDTIVNAKLGVRFGLGDRTDMYAGYGRALTGDTWYKDIWRVELRWHS